MTYDLVRPCPKCPFRNDIPAYLTQDRAEEIAYDGAEFACHETTTDSFEEDEEGYEVETLIATEESKHCAGLLILLEKEERPHQMMRICERLGFYDMRKLDMTVPVYDTIEEFIEAQAR